MADSGKNAVTTHTGDGTTTTFEIGFEYLDTSHIEVVIDTSITQVLGTDFDVATNGDDIDFDVAPDTGETITITRNTPSTSLTVDPTAGAGLREADLENLIWQALYYAEEVEDQI